MGNWTQADVVQLTYNRLINGAAVTSLTVTVMVYDQRSGITLLATRPTAEIPAGSGNYTYAWTHGLTQDTPCMVVYTVNGKRYLEDLFVTPGTSGGRAT